MESAEAPRTTHYALRGPVNKTARHETNNDRNLNHVMLQLLSHFSQDVTKRITVCPCIYLAVF